MNDMIIPEEIYFMTPAMNPITLEIYNKKSNDISKNGCFDMKDRNVIYQPIVSNDGNANTKNILNNIGHAAAETWYAVKTANNIGSFFPFNNFLNKKKEDKKGNSDI